MAVNQHMVGVELPLLHSEVHKDELQNGHINGYLELKRKSENCIYINSDYIYKLTLNSSPKFDKSDEYDQHRIIIIEGFKSYEDGLNCIVHRDFAAFIKSCPFVFVIIARCVYPNFNEKRNISNMLKQRYRTKRPLIVIFESDYPKIFYKNHGYYSRFIEYESDAFEAEPNVTDFGTLLLNFEANGLGYFGGYFDQISINNIEAAQKLMDVFASRKDLLGIRFLHLFESSLRPDIKYIREVLADDYKNIELDGFCAIFDYNIEDYGSRKLETSNSHSIAGRDAHLILSSTLENQENLLMVAIRCRNKNAVKLFINCGINLNLLNGPETLEIAADIAYKTSQFDFLLLLLEANSRFPHGFSTGVFDNLTNDLKEFINLTIRLHDLIKNINDDEKVEEISMIFLEDMKRIIEIYPQLDYWYDQYNESAARKAIRLKKFKTYNFLLQNGLFVGPFEDIAAIKATLSASEQDKIREINARNAQKIPKDYLLVLQLNSFIWKNQKSENLPAALIESTFNILDENELIQPILQIVAEAKSFRIIFDFNHTSVEALDFTSRSTTSAVFHLRQSHIYIGAKDLLDEDKKYETIATLAHELCHFAILLTYNNLCNPYAEIDVAKRERFKKICDECEKLKDREYLVSLVYKYGEERQHAELIVRAPHMMIHYIKNQDLLTILNNVYNSLFCFYEKSVIPDIKNKINNVSQQFAENLRFEHEFWEKKKRKQKIIKNLLILAVLLTVGLAGLSIMLLMFLEPCITFDTTCKWDELRETTRQRILDTDVRFNNNFMKLADVTKDHPEALKFLSSDEIKLPSKISINEQDLSLPFRYHERMFTEYNEGYFYTNSNCTYKYIYKCNLTTYESQLQSQKVYLISDEPVAGKSTTLKNIARHKRSQTLSKWVVYLNFENFNFENYSKLSNWTSTNVTNFFIDVHNLDSVKIDPNSMESEIFKKKFENGDVILIIDHIDWIFTQNENIGEIFLKNLIEKSNKNAELWFATRNWFGEKIEQIIDKIVKDFAGRYKLVPLHCDDRENFIKNSIIDRDLRPNEVDRVKERFKDVLDFTEKWRSWKKVKFDNICLLKLILNHTIESVHLNEINVNFYNILEAYTIKILALNSADSEKDVKNNRAATDKTLMTVALRFVDLKYTKSLKHVNMTELIVDELDSINFEENKENKSEEFTVYGPNGNDWNIETQKIQSVLKLGILKIENGEILFLHEINLEFYIAKYIRDQMWYKKNWIPESHLFQQKLLFLFNIFKDLNTQFPIVQRCITDAVQSVQSSDRYRIKYDEKFKELYKKMYANYTKDTNIDVGKYLVKVFDDDEDMKRIVRKSGEIHMKNLRRSTKPTEN